MSTAATVLAYVNALKWPTVVVGGVAYFHKPLSTLLDRISTAHEGNITGPGGTGISWSDTLREVDAALDVATTTQPALAGASTTGSSSDATRTISADQEWESIVQLVDSSPGAAVVMAFTQVELALRQRATHEGLLDQRPMGALQLMRRLDLDTELEQAIRQLSHLRNEVTHHNAKPERAEALEYVNTARKLYDYLAVQV